jgi:hypothetical protein
MADFYGCFVESYSQLVKLLHTLKQKGAKFIWMEPQQTSFEWLMATLLTRLTLPGNLCQSAMPVRWQFQPFSITREVKI